MAQARTSSIGNPWGRWRDLWPCLRSFFWAPSSLPIGRKPKSNRRHRHRSGPTKPTTCPARPSPSPARVGRRASLCISESTMTPARRGGATLTSSPTRTVLSPTSSTSQLVRRRVQRDRYRRDLGDGDLELYGRKRQVRYHPTTARATFVENIYIAATDCTGAVRTNGGFPDKALTNSNGDNVGVGNSESLRVDASATTSNSPTLSFLALSRPPTLRHSP